MKSEHTSASHNVSRKTGLKYEGKRRGPLPDLVALGKGTVQRQEGYFRNVCRFGWHLLKRQVAISLTGCGVQTQRSEKMASNTDPSLISKDTCRTYRLFGSRERQVVFFWGVRHSKLNLP